jgi:hypothetical protein
MKNARRFPRLRSTKPLGARAESKRKLGTAVGVAIVAAGLVFNQWVLARMFSSSGQIESASVRTIIWSVEALLIFGGIFVIKHPRYGRAVLLSILPILSLAVCSFVVFVVLELFPSLIAYMPFAHVRYYAYKGRVVLDDELVYKNRPSSKVELRSFKGDLYRDSYGVDVKPMPYTAMFDKDGFRNGPMPPAGWDVVVLGDSYVEFGHDEDDTLTSRLAVLTGLTTRNLGTGGYGPFQYVRVLQRYGLTPRPKHALFCFFEGNDIEDIRNYVRWRENAEAYGNFHQTGKNLVQRYLMALRDVVFAPLARALRGPLRTPADLVTLKVGGADIKTVFSYEIEARKSDDLLKMDEWRILKELLGQFKAICAENNIVPIVVYIPTKAHIYAEYSTADSGAKWMTIRDQQIAARANVETAVRSLCREVGVELISLSPAFERAARQGTFLYYPFDTHWNSEARQLSATVLAEALSSTNATKNDKR